MSNVILKATTRTVTGKQMRSERTIGQLPIVVYGHSITARNLWVSFLDFTKAYKIAGESAILELQVTGEKNNANVLIQDIQLDPLSGKVTHADLLQVRMDEEIEAHIPLEFTGESVAVKALGGMLLKNTDEILVSCLPADLPPVIMVDISALATFDDHIKVSDLKISSKVKVLSDVDMIIAGVTPPRTEAQMAELEEKAEADVTKVEGVIKETDTKTESK